MQNKVQPAMDEIADDGATELCHPEKTAFEERRLLPQEIFHPADTGDAGDCENLMLLRSVSIYLSINSKSMYPKGYIRRILPLIAAISNHISTKIICSVYVFRHVNYDIHRIFFVCNNACLNLILIVFV